MSNSDIKERGAAAIHIALSQGVISVRHTTAEGPLLAQWTANAGDWDALWLTIKGLQAVAS